MWILEPQINKLIGRNLTGHSSSSYATSNGISYPDNKSPDSESISAFKSDIWSSNTTSLFSKIDLGCPVCQHEFCFSLLLCATEKAQNHLLENTEKVIRDLHTRLHAVSLECTVLRSELEVIHKAFTSKCEALKILTLNDSQSPGKSNELLNAVYASNVQLKKDNERLKIELELSKGELLSQHQSSEAKIQQLQMENENLVRQLENLQLKTKQLLEENIHLLRKNMDLSCTSSCDRTPKESFDDAKSDMVSEIYLNENFLQKLTDQEAPLTSETALYSLENQLKPYDSVKQVYRIIKPTMKSTPVPQNRFPSFFSRLRSSGSEKVEVNRYRKLRKSSYIEKDSQCDFISSPYRNPCIKEIPISLKCMCEKKSEVPCTCARTAIGIQRQLLRCRCELSRMRKKLEELEISEDAHRHALKEQYEKNINMSIHLAGILPYTPIDLIKPPNYVLSTSVCESSSRISPVNIEDHSIVPKYSSTESLNNLFTWFHKILNTTSTSMKSLSLPSSSQLPFDQNKEDPNCSRYTYPKDDELQEQANTANTSNSPNECYAYDYEKIPNFDKLNKLYNVPQNGQISLATKRKISKTSNRITKTPVSFQSIDINNNDKFNSEPACVQQLTNGSTVQNPVVYQRKTSRSSSRYADRLKSRCRSVDHTIILQISKDKNISAALQEYPLPQVVNDPAGLTLQQKLVCDKRTRRSSSALS
ncbi:unnamed protein product [Trichobilharzia szidati]|nr:unnamed protein product [Trichobilharzia szidati]